MRQRRPAPRGASRSARPFGRSVPASATVLYVCIPTYNEAVTVGVLLWRLRTVLGAQGPARDYEVVVYDDASDDATPEVLAPYARVLPLTVLRAPARGGQSAAVEALVRHVVARSTDPAADALALLQADFTDAPELLPTLLASFDAGADVAVARRAPDPAQPAGEYRLRRLAALLLPLGRAAARDPAAGDPAALVSFMRVFRVAVLRDALRAAGRRPLLDAPGVAGRAELLVRAAPFARHVARIDAPQPPAQLRTRASRLEWPRELRALTALLWRLRGGAPGRTAPAPDAPAARARPRGRPDPAAGPPAPAAPSAGAEPSGGDPLGIDPLGTDPLGAEPAADATRDPNAAAEEPRARRRRRSPRRRGRAAAAAAGDANPDGGDAAPPGPAGTAPDIEPARDDAEPDTATEAATETDTEGAPARRRRRRRGGSRRGARGGDAAAGADDASDRQGQPGVAPADTDGDAATR